jgi:hypothetical protein
MTNTITNKYYGVASNPWKPVGSRGVPFISWLTFSSKSPFFYDNWARDVKRPYQIVLTPGYTPPSRTGKLANDCDIVWYERPVNKPTIVWDGFGIHAMFEITYECFRVDLVGPNVRVRDAFQKKWMVDPRSSEFLSKRPARYFSFPDPIENPGKYQSAMRDHRRNLASWAYVSMTECAKRIRDNGGNPSDDEEVCFWSQVSEMYSSSLNRNGSLHRDSFEREQRGLKKLKNKDSSFMDSPSYTSPLVFADTVIEKAAKKSFTPTSVEAQNQARRRIEKRRQHFTKIADDADVPQKSFWGKLFQFK